MTGFKVGDIVRLTKGESGHPGYEQKIRRIVELWSDDGDISPAVLGTYQVMSGWTVELIERPAPLLPTTPNTLGWATVDGTSHLARLAYGQWELYDADGSLGATPHPSTIEDFTEAALIPKELADKITAWTADPFRRGATIGATLNRIADHLKGQDDE